MSIQPFRIATGHPATSEAARFILEQGGNAADAVISAVFTACVAEPMLASLGGGGHALIQTADQQTVALDFFAQTPRTKHPGPIDFYPILGNFGTDVQEFHVGMASIATPGVLAGLDELHARFGSLPKKELIAFATEQAKQGIPLNTLQHHTLEILEPIVRATPQASRWAGLSDPNAPLPEVQTRWSNPAFADFLSDWADDGAVAFYEGELAHDLVEACERQGGHLTHADLRLYRAQWRTPLSWTYRDTTLWSNPPPAFGGMMLALSLADLAHQFETPPPFGSPAHLQALITAMDSALASRKRLDTPSLLADEEALRAEFERVLQSHATSSRGTTHLSIDDGQGMGVALTLSNGEGSGHVLTSGGIMMNNMLGEEDLNRGGFHQWPTNRRLASMMTPTIFCRGNGDRYLLGSGGSNRIRTALMQVIANLVDFGLPLPEAIAAPRIHLEGEHLSLELASEWAESTQNWLIQNHAHATPWPSRSLFFGGVHAVGPEGAYADARREGSAIEQPRA